MLINLERFSSQLDPLLPITEEEIEKMKTSKERETSFMQPIWRQLYWMTQVPIFCYSKRIKSKRKVLD